MEPIKEKLPKLPTISFANNQRPSLPAYQDFLKAKTFEVCWPAGGHKGAHLMSNAHHCPLSRSSTDYCISGAVHQGRSDALHHITVRLWCEEFYIGAAHVRLHDWWGSPDTLKTSSISSITIIRDRSSPIRFLREPQGKSISNAAGFVGRI